MKPKNPLSNNKKSALFLCVILILIAPLAAILFIRLESSAPEVHLNIPESLLGASSRITGDIADLQTGLKKLHIALMKGEKEALVLLDEKFPAGMIFKGGTVFKKSVDLLVEPRKSGLKDGPIVLKITVVDYSWRKWWNGNKSVVEKPLTIDTVPPQINVLTKAHNINQGGMGLVIYKMNEKNTKNGVYVGDHFYPGYSGCFSDDQIYLCFFSITPEQGRDTALHISAIDGAGNKGRGGFYYHIRRKIFKEDRIPVTDSFLDSKMPEFDTSEFGVTDPSGIKKFLAVNRNLRIKNDRQITAPGKNPERKIYWEGAFERLPQSAPRAAFADHRTYVYNGEEVDQQYHMGIDLASLKFSPVPAANAGKTVLTEDIGIYGKTVVLDHGFGLFSVYSHLNQITTAVGKIVTKNEVIGMTGMTGLAVGDHLHFSMFVHDTFVNPIEWWDPSWIKNNITSKIEEVKALSR
jgi:hypothetical protein